MLHEPKPIRALSAETTRQVVEQIRAGLSPEAVLEPLLAEGWDEQEAIDALEHAMRGILDEHAQRQGLPPSTQVPGAFERDGSSALKLADRTVQVLGRLQLPRVVTLGGLLSKRECASLIVDARTRIKRSTTVDLETGADQVHEARTSEGMCYSRGETPLCRVIEQRIAELLDWPLEFGEGLQVLRYGVGAEYRPHYDYFDPAFAGSHVALKRGGQRVASVVMYLNTPERGGATVFPDAGFEVSAVQGNAVFFSYDRPHPMTRSLHGGAPVLAGEKWIATKWLRQGHHD